MVGSVPVTPQIITVPHIHFLDITQDGQSQENPLGEQLTCAFLLELLLVTLHKMIITPITKEWSGKHPVADHKEESVKLLSAALYMFPGVETFQINKVILFLGEQPLVLADKVHPLFLCQER